MRRFRIGRLVGPWTNRKPPIRSGAVYASATSGAQLPCHTIDLNDTLIDSAYSSGSSSEGGQADGEHQIVNCTKARRHQGRTQIKHVPPEQPASLRVRDAATEEFIRTILQAEIQKSLQDYPSLTPETQRNIERKFQDLHKRVKNEGFYQCHYSEYLKEIARYSVLFVLFITAFLYQWYWFSAALLGLFWHQIMFTAHDAGHRAITHNFVGDTCIGIFIADFCCGLSIGWWKSSHNVHHLITNHPEHDPDIQNVPLFATCASFFKTLHSTYYDFTFVWDSVADLAVRYQRYTYYPVMGLARFNLYILSIHHLIMGPRSSKSTAWIRKAEIAGIACYWFWFGYCLVWRSLPDWPTRIAFVLISHIVTMPLHVQITLSHWGMPTSDLGDAESFPQRQLRTTMDVQCPAWLDFIHGGLQFQAVHHLFPRVPRHNLRRLQVLVRQFCEELGIKYSILGFVDGNREVIGRLGEVTAQVEMMLRCQQYMAQTGESGLH